MAFYLKKCSGVGIGLRSKHHLEVISSRPKVNWWEVHTENFFAFGGRRLKFLEDIAKEYPLSFHGVGLSLGSAEGISAEHLKQIKFLIDLFNPSLVSEHISWSAISGDFINDLLPIPYNQESLSIICDNIKKFQDYIGRQILVENPSSYTGFKISTMTEDEFVVKVVEKTGCGLLLDINNIYVSSKNLDFSAKEYINRMLVIQNSIQEIHLAGHSILENKYNQRFLVDTHDDNVCEDVWELYKYIISCIGIRPTLIEWDQKLPELSVLIAEANKAQKIMDDAASRMVLKNENSRTSENVS